MQYFFVDNSTKVLIEPLAIQQEIESQKSSLISLKNDFQFLINKVDSTQGLREGGSRGDNDPAAHGLEGAHRGLIGPIEMKHQRPFFFLFWRSPEFEHKNRFSFGEDLFFFLEIT